MSEERKAAERLAFRFLCLIALIFVVLYVIPQFWDKLSPFIIAVPIAALLQPVIAFLQKRLKMKRGLASIIIVLLLIAVILLLLIWIFNFGIGQVSRFVNNSGDMITDNVNAVRQAMNRVLAHVNKSSDPAVENWLRTAVNALLTRLTEWGSHVAEDMVTFSVSLATSLPYALIYASFLGIGLYFITAHYQEIRSYLPGGARRRQDSKTTLIAKSAVKSLTGYLRVQGTFGIMVWILSWIALACFGFKYAGITALFLGVMEMVPMIGSGVPYIIMGVLQFLLGFPAKGIQLLLTTLVLQTLRRILEPKMMSDSIGVTPLQSLVGMFIGMRLGGILGLILGPVMMSVIVGAYRANLHGSAMQDIRCLTKFFRARWK